MILIFRLPIPCASNQCNSATWTLPSNRRTDATPFNFRHLAEPYRFLRRGRMRILLPTAMISILVISPMISKCIVNHYTFTTVEGKSGPAWTRLILPKNARVLNPLFRSLRIGRVRVRRTSPIPAHERWVSHHSSRSLRGASRRDRERSETECTVC